MFFGLAVALFLLAPMAHAETYCPPESMKGTVPDSYFQNCTPAPEGADPSSMMPSTGTPPEGMQGPDAGALESAKAQIGDAIVQVKAQEVRLLKLISSAKEHDIDVGELQALYDQVKLKLAAAQKALDANQIEEAGALVNEVKAMNIEAKIKEVEAKLKSLVDPAQINQVVGQIEMGIKALEKMVLLAQIKGIEPDEIKTTLDTIKPLYQELLEASNANDAEKMGEVLQKIKDSGFQQKMEYFRDHSDAIDFKEAFAQIERSIQIGEKAIEKGKAEKKDTSKLEKLIATAKDKLAKAKALFANNGNPQEIGTILDEIKEMPWDETMDNVFRALHEKTIKSMLEESFGVVNSGVARMKSLIAKLKEENVDTTAVDNFAAKLLSAFDAAQKAYEAGTLDEAGQLMDQVASFGDLVEKFLADYKAKLDATEVNALDLTPLKAMPAEFLKSFDQSTQGKFGNMFDSVSADKRNEMMQFIMGQSSDEAQSLALLHSENPESVDTLFDLIMAAPQKYRQALIDQKKLLVDRTDQLEGQINKLLEAKKIGIAQQQELKDMIQKVKNYNFYGKGGEEIAKALENFLATALAEGQSKAQVLAGVQALLADYQPAIDEAIQSKYKDGIIPFKDTDDQEWYTDYVRYVKDNEIASGYKDANGNPLGEYRPGNAISYMEAMKIALEASGHGQLEGEPSLKNYPAWGKGYVKEAEALGLNAVQDKAKSLNGSIDRAATVRLILEAFGVSPADIADRFPDIVSSRDRFFVQKAAELGIVSGNPDGTFKPNNPVNRAEMAKMIQKAIEVLKP